MSYDMLTFVNVASGFVLTGIGFEMVHNPPNNIPWKTWTYRGLFVLFGFSVAVTTVMQSIRNEKAQENERAVYHSDQLLYQANLSQMRGKLDTIAKFASVQPAKCDASLVLAILKIAQSGLLRLAPQNLSSPATGTTPTPAPTTTPALRPTILSANNIYGGEAEVTGKNFGSKPGEVYVHLRVKPFAQRGPYSADGVVGPDHLLGSIDLTDRFPVNDYVQSWTDTSIRMKLPKGYLQGYISRINDVAQIRGYQPPSPEDLEVGVVVIPTGGEWIPQFQDFFYGR
jgi:hypothetical protein